jgi:acetyl-CoA carboxylase carboxyl transferase subunit alpha
MPETDVDKTDLVELSGEKRDRLTAFQRVQLARHNDRPYTLDFVERLFEDFVELHGDRRFADDAAVICGMANFHGLPVVVVGHQKGRDMKQRRFRNFGMPKPEGYRKALRAMKLAEKFGRPVICFIDTPGAYPGIDAEERGQAEAIAYNLREAAKLRIPVIVAVIG